MAGCSTLSQASSQQSEHTNISESHQAIQQMNGKKQDHHKNNKNNSNNKNTKPISSFNLEQFTQNNQWEDSLATSKKSSQSRGIIPVSIKIPTINVKAEVIKKGIVKKGEYKGHMAVPHNAEQTAWYKLGPKPGQKGSAIIAGHVDYNGVAVFFHLRELQSGDLVYVTGKNGKTLTFKVFKKKVYPMHQIPLQKVFGYTPARVLRLLTCTGPFNEEKHTHIDRLVISTKLVDTSDKSS